MREEGTKEMKALDTTYITLRDGTAIWLSPEASASRETLEALLKEAASSEIRRVIRAGEGLTLMLGGEPLGQQAWLKEGMREEDITEGVF